MEKYRPGLLKTALISGAGILALSACADTTSGQTEPPTLEEIRNEGEFFELGRPDGSTMVCWSFGARGDGLYGESPSWFAVTCDWAGDYTEVGTEQVEPSIATLPESEG